MTSIPLDICRDIVNIIKNDNDKCRLLMTCKEISKCNFYFNENINASEIINSQWFDRFTNVTINKKINKLPLNVTHLTFDAYFNKVIHDYISFTITHLRIYCNIGFINRKLPISITDLYFSGSDEKIMKYLPSELIVLRFDTSILASINVGKPI